MQEPRRIVLKEKELRGWQDTRNVVVTKEEMMYVIVRSRFGGVYQKYTRTLFILPRAEPEGV